MASNSADNEVFHSDDRISIVTAFFMAQCTYETTKSCFLNEPLLSLIFAVTTSNPQQDLFCYYATLWKITWTVLAHRVRANKINNNK